MNKLLTSIPVLSLTSTATAEISAHRFVGFDGAQAGDGGSVYGVSKTDAKPGDDFGIDVIGVIDMIAGAAISAGDEIQSNADGAPIPKVAGQFAGRATTAAANPGDIVKILLK